MVELEGAEARAVPTAASAPHVAPAGSTRRSQVSFKWAELTLNNL